MGKEKTYFNTVAGFKKWCKDHGWNTKFEEEKEYKTVAGVYVELSLNNDSWGNMECYVSIREYYSERKTFQLVDNAELGEGVKKHIQDLINKFAKKHDCEYKPEII